MSLVKILIYVTEAQRTKLKALRGKGYTASGYIRSLLERELNQPSPKGQKGR